MNRNHLKGKNGDQINAILSACGFNMRKLMAVFLCLKLIEQLLTQNYKRIENQSEIAQYSFGY